MREYMELGSAPCDEECAQVGSADYHERMRVEAKAYIGQLKRMFPSWEAAGCRFYNKGFPHDFGTYHEICISWETREGMEFAMNVEKHLPAKWDTIAQLAIDLYNGPRSSYDASNRLVTS
jgi:hypothetical protein